MKVLFAQNMIHVPAHGGANKANRLLAESLVANGHECHVVAPLTGVMATGGDPTERLSGLGAQDVRTDDTAVVYDLGGVKVHSVRSPSRLMRRIKSVAAEVRPDWIVVPSDDPGGMVLAAALAAAPDRVVYLAYTIQQLPFGPAAFYPSTSGAGLVRRAAGVVAISRAVRSYLYDHGGLASELIYLSVYGPVPPVRHATGDTGSITMINPCGYKGLPIFLGLAEAFPDLPFLAVPTWGTTAEDRARLARLPNIEITAPVDDIDVLLRRTRMLVVPSLWDETFGFSCVDAMLRGVPVLAASIAGLVEAKLGVPYALPVRRIESYDATADRARPVPDLPEQDLTPWVSAVRRLVDDPVHYADLSARSRTAAVSFVERLDERALEHYLLALKPRAA